MLDYFPTTLVVVQVSISNKKVKTLDDSFLARKLPSQKVCWVHKHALIFSKKPRSYSQRKADLSIRNFLFIRFNNSYFEKTELWTKV